MVKTDTVPLALLQARFDEIEPSDKKILIADAMRMLKGAILSLNGLYSIVGLDWLIVAEINFSSMTALRLADLEGLPSNNTIGPLNARPIQDLRLAKKRKETREIPDKTGTHWATCEDISVSTSTSSSCEGESLSKASNTGR